MRKIINIWFLAVLFTVYSISAFAQMSVVIGSGLAKKSGDTVVIPVNAKGLNDIGSFGLWISIDTNVITNFPGDTIVVSNVYSPLTSGFAYNFNKTGNQGPTLI